MDITHTLKVVKVETIDDGSLNDVVTNVYVRVVSSTEYETFESMPLTCTFDEYSERSFKPFSELTKEEVLSWVRKLLRVELSVIEKEHEKKFATKKVYRQNNVSWIDE